MSLRNVIAVLEDGEEQLWRTFETAVDLADDENARLTLAKTNAADRAYLWLSPFAYGGVYVPPPVDTTVEAERLLARAAEFVPDRIPVTTQLLGPCTQEALRAIIRCGRHDALVAGPKLLFRCPKLVRELRRREIWTITACEPGRGAGTFARVSARFLAGLYPLDQLGSEDRTTR